MPVHLSDQAREQAIASIKRFLEDTLDIEAGDLRAMALLDFFLKELAPSAYNAGVLDAQTYLRDRVADLEGACFEPEFAYWQKSGGRRRQ